MARRKGRRTKTGKRKTTFKKASAPKIQYRTRTKTKVRYYSRPTRRVTRYRGRGVAVRSRQARTRSLVFAAVASAGVGAMMGSLANEAGLLNRAPSQNYVGISATGLVGAGLVIVGLFVKSEAMKLLFYGFGGGLLIEELTRQIDMRFYDFRVAFYGATPLDYSAGISGAQLQLAQVSATKNGAASSPSQLPTKPPEEKASTPASALRPSLNAEQKELLNRITADDMSSIEFWILNAPAGEGSSESIRQTLVDKKLLTATQALPLEPQTIAILDTMDGYEASKIKAYIKAGANFVSATEAAFRDKGSLGPVESLGERQLISGLYSRMG